MRSSILTFLTTSTLITAISAQTYTDCNPLDKTCPEDTGLPEYNFSTDFTKGNNTNWIADTGTTITYSDLGAAFTINTAGQAPTIHTSFYIQFGYIEVKLRASPGTGIISSIVLESDDLDEIDWEFLGGNNTSVETNYFGKGNTTSYDRAIYYPVTTPTETFHTYALNWTSESLTWFIDNIPVRTLLYDEALSGQNYPQTPCIIKLGIWAGGASTSEGTIEWAGGATDFSDAPFTMYVDSVNIVNYNPAEMYKWTDMTGGFGSIEVVNGSVTGMVGDTDGNAMTSESAPTSVSKSASSVSGGGDKTTVSAVAEMSATSSGSVGATNSAGASFAQTSSSSSSGAAAASASAVRLWSSSSGFGVGMVALLGMLVAGDLTFLVV